MKTPVIKNTLAEILEEYGLDDAYIAGKVRQFCDAEKKVKQECPLITLFS